MIYTLLTDLKKYLEAKLPRTSIEEDILQRVSRALPVMLKEQDTELLSPNEILVRICPETKHPVLVCYDGDGMCLCLHNDTVQEDMLDVGLWLQSRHSSISPDSHSLLETVARLAYKAGTDNLCEGKDPGQVMADIIRRAWDFEAQPPESETGSPEVTGKN